MPQSDPPHDPPASQPAIQVESLTAGYGRTFVIEDVNFSIEAGSRVALVGPNGAGKSTLFRAIVGLIAPAQGRILIDGHAQRRFRRLAAYVPQFEDVDWDFPVSVIDVVLMGLAREIGWLRLASNRHRVAALDALEQVGLRSYAQRQIGELSGGQKRRVFIARAVAQGARILLLDEPFSGVDAVAQQTLFDILDTLRTASVTVLLATHDLSLINTHFDKLLILNRTAIAYGTPADVFTPEIMANAFGRQMTVWQRDGEMVILADQHS